MPSYSPCVILSEAKNLPSLRANSAKNLLSLTVNSAKGLLARVEPLTAS